MNDTTNSASTPSCGLPADETPGPPEDGWRSGDPFGQIFHALRMTGVVYSRAHLTAPWGVDLPPLPNCLLFHVVTSGSAWLEVPGADPLELRPGEFVLVPRGQGHAIRDAQDTPVVPFFDLPIERVAPRYERLTYGGGGSATTLICGAVRLEHPGARELVEQLPPVVHIPTWDDPRAEWMHSTLRLMAHEVSDRRPGGETVMTRLADILVVQALRHWLETTNEDAGWLSALRDPRIGPALVRIHTEPEADWTVASLARSVSMSRSAFSEKFTKAIGEPVVQYLTRWRMHVAGSWLLDSNITLAECADRLGYQSEAAFQRAFKRVTGKAPGTWRRDERAARAAVLAMA